MTSDRKHLLRQDPRAVWAGRWVGKRDAALGVAYGRLARLSAAYWGVALGDDCAFYGRTLFRRAPASTLVVGERCIFRSAIWSNQVGVDRPCQLSTLRAGAHLVVGYNCGFSGTVLAAAESIVLGDRVVCGANVTITDTDWHGVRPEERRDAAKSAPVEIGDDVWIGLNALVLKGVRIGRGSVIAAGSVVTRDVPEGVIAAGNPVVVVREL